MVPKKACGLNALNYVNENGIRSKMDFSYKSIEAWLVHPTRLIKLFVVHVLDHLMHILVHFASNNNYFSL